MVQLRSLEVRNVRGVRELSVDVGDKSIVLLGPNGAGKSSVVDALDFLLTGDVRRLSGEGAGALSLAEHGRNVLAAPEDAWVEASFSVLDGTSERVVTLKRSLATASALDWVGKESAALSELLDRVGRSGHHLLGRREILKYILAQPSARHEHVAALMQLDGIEDLRKELQGAAKRGREDLKTQRAVAQRCAVSLLSCVSPPARDAAEVLARVNAHRSDLGGGPLGALDARRIRVAIAPSGITSAHPLQAAGTTETVAALVAVLSAREALIAPLREYAADVHALATDHAALAAHRAHELITRGRDLATGSECPLCLLPWPAEELRALLLQRIAASEEASNRVVTLGKRRESLLAELESLRGCLSSLVKDLTRGPKGLAAGVATPLGALTSALEAILPDAVAGPAPSMDQVDAFAKTLTELSLAVHALEAQAKLLPRLDRVSAMWDELGAVERALGELAKAEADLPATERLANALTAADKLFAATRGDVLAGTYAAISGRLQQLYASIHGEGAGAEKDFSASLEPAGAGLKLEVDFYGKGKFPPAALHSEGHQDTLGICLFLALAEHVSGGPITLLILDDVLMSVDAEHRRAVAAMLRREFSTTQFVITTHDEVWARHLKSVGLSGAPLVLTTWTLEGGAITTVATKDPIVAARAALAEGRVETAAHALRRGLEERLREICVALNGKVHFKEAGDYGLGDFRDAVKAAFTNALAKAQKSAVSWDLDTTALTAMQAAYTTSSLNVQAEEWTVNLTVHANSHAVMTAGDLKPVIDAFEAFLAFFACKRCKGDLHIAEHRGLESKDLRCSCGQTSYNLQPKPKAKQP